MKLKFSQAVLVILDGWGVAPPSRGNGISSAVTPIFEKLVSQYPTLTLQASGEAVGLPWGEMGNSEVGHMNLGGGKVIFQNLPRINQAISQGTFFKNEVFLEIVKHVRLHDSQLHLMGLVSNGGVHSYNEHLYALLEFCQKQKLRKVFIHAFLDGRDTTRNGAQDFIAQLEDQMRANGVGRIATLIGRFYAMDRDNRWPRTEKAYLAIAEGLSEKMSDNPLKAIEESYAQNIFDEEFLPTVITENGVPLSRVNDNDALLFFNFRADRARQLTKALILPGFEKFKRPREIKNLFFATMTEYEKDLPVKVAFPPEEITEPIAKVFSDNGYQQLHIAETEKYAHVTFFFNGGREDKFPGEDRILIPSPSVSTYDQKPEMSAHEVTERLLKEIASRHYQFTVVNYANADMVGHTGNREAVIKAVETVDRCLGQVIELVLAEQGIAVITADHGNAEEILDLQTGVIDKEHETNPVPFILVGKPWLGKIIYPIKNGDLSRIRPAGILADVAPTILKIMGLKKPLEMTGRSLI